MTTPPTPKKPKESTVPKGPPNRWGTSSARFFARLEGELIRVHFENGEVLTGSLMGLDLFDLFIEREGITRLIAKHAVAWIEPEPAAVPLKAQAT